MSFANTLGGIGVALGVGLLVGLERQRSAAKRDADWFGGIRTFALLGLVGALLGALAVPIGPWLPGLGIVGLGAVLFIPAVLELHAGKRSGITTEVAGLLVACMGILATTDWLDPVARWQLVLAVGVVAMGLLSFRKGLHHLAERIEQEDLRATVKLALLLVIVLPLLPNVGLGPSALINPYDTGLLVSLIAAIGFSGYVAVRALGPERGMAITGLVGGLVSSTAVTLNFAGRVREHPAFVASAALGVVLASAVMVPRILVLCWVVSPSLLHTALLPLGVMAALSFGLAGVLFLVHLRAPDQGGPVGFDNPFSLSQALKFGAAFLVVKVLTGLATEQFGEGALYVSAALSAVTSVDAITLTVADMHQAGLDDQTAVAALLVAALSNTLAKTALGTALGGWRLGLRLLGVFGPMLVAGAVALWMTTWTG